MDHSGDAFLYSLVKRMKHDLLNETFNIDKKEKETMTREEAMKAMIDGKKVTTPNDSFNNVYLKMDSWDTGERRFNAYIRRNDEYFAEARRFLDPDSGYEIYEPEKLSFEYLENHGVPGETKFYGKHSSDPYLYLGFLANGNVVFRDLKERSSFLGSLSESTLKGYYTLKKP